MYERQADRKEVMRKENQTADDKIDPRKCEKSGQTVQAMTMQINDAVHRIVVEIFASATDKSERERNGECKLNRAKTKRRSTHGYAVYVFWL